MNKKKKDKLIAKIIVSIVWGIFLVINLNAYIKLMIPTHEFYRSKDPYTVDSVWHTGSTTQYNDVLLYTLFSEKTVYINSESWYFDYVQAYAKNTVAKQELSALIGESEIDKFSYMQIGHMSLIVNDVLFDKAVIDAISGNEANGMIDLYIDENELLTGAGIAVLHDENGNLYLRGYDNE